MRHIHCVRPARCERLRNATCFGSRLPYTMTSIDLTDSFHQEESRDRLRTYEALRHIPKCWAVVQPFLCAAFLPRCERIADRDMVFLPSLEMCRIIIEPCRLLYDTSFFPDFLRCNETLFPSRCNNDMREVKFNTSGECRRPLVASDQPSSYYAAIEGCGLQCRDPLYTDDEHRQAHNLISAAASICLVCNLLTVLTFLIDWPNANKYPAVIIFYINLCFLVNCAAWLAQFPAGNRQDIVCRKDGTLRHAEPSAGENLSCIAVFLAVYYSLVAAMVWFVIFAYSWHLRALGSVHRIDKKSSYFHLIAWSLPLVLTIATMALSEVDGNSMTGICFVGYVNQAMRAGFVMGPLAGVLLCAGFFVGRGMVTLVPLRRYTADKSMSASKKIHGIIVRMALTAAVVGVFIGVCAVCELNEFRQKAGWTESLRQFVVCRIATSTDDQPDACKMGARPSLAVLQVQLLCLFVTGVLMSSWCWTRQSLGAWRRYLRRKCGGLLGASVDGRDADGNGTPGVGLKQKQKYKIIAQTYAKRKEFQDTGRLSVSFYEAHSDPAGLNFDINDLHSVATNEMSSTWCNYLPKITRRRPALAPVNGHSLAGAGAGTGGTARKSSVDSEISVSYRQYSLESRRNSMDSQVSLQIAEVQTKVACRSTTGGKKAPKSVLRGKSRFQPKHTHRRGSSTSMESHIIIGRTRSGGGDKRMRRRSANAGLSANANDISAFIERFPELTRNFQGMQTSDEDAMAGGGSQQLCIEDARFDVVVRQQQQHSDDEGEALIDRLNGSRSQRADESVLLGMQQQHHFRRQLTIVDDVGGRQSKNGSQKSAGSGNDGRSLNGQRATLRKSGPNGLRKSHKRRSTARKSKRPAAETAGVLLDAHRLRSSPSMSASSSSFTSYASNFPLAVGPPTAGGVQSSYSAVSLGKHSRSSKTSCDVGTQANAREIATLTRSGQRRRTNDSDCMNSSDEMNSEEDERQIAAAGRSQASMAAAAALIADTGTGVSAPAPSSAAAASMMLLMSGQKRRPGSGRRLVDGERLSEAEKLRMLLLPSK